MRTYTINESAARLSHEMRSFDDYEKGSATAGYNADVAEAAAILERVKALCSTEAQKEHAEYLFDRYARTLAEAINRDNEIGTRCPSVMICGAGNFPTRKKEKQVKAWEANHETFRKAEHYLDLLKTAHTLTVKSNDPEVLDYLREKLAGLEAGHEMMVSANAYYRKNKTLDGFEASPPTLWHGSRNRRSTPQAGGTATGPRCSSTASPSRPTPSATATPISNG